LALPRSDRAADDALKAYEAASCPAGHHPDLWTDIRRPVIVPEWRYCRICELVTQAQDAGPKAGKDAKGWYLAWTTPTYDKEVTAHG